MNIFPSTRQIGSKAEDLAVKHLKRLGYKIIKRNFTIRGGEIDIIAQDGEELVFVEVKARYSRQFGSPIEAITPWKIQHLIKSAAVYANMIDWGNRPYRLDALSIDYSTSADNPDISLLKNLTG